MTTDPSKPDLEVEFVDPELEQLLGDVYDAPPVPRSLLKQIHRAVEAEWGESPEVSDSQPINVRRQFLKPSHWFRAIPAAACLGIVVAAVLFFSSGTTTYAWSRVIEAMAQQGLIELKTDSGHRWLSLSDGVLGESNSNSISIADANQRAVFFHQYGTDRVMKQTLSAARFVENDLLVQFLAGDVTNPRQYSNLRVSNESWEQVNGEVQLNVNFEASAGDTLNLHLVLDEKTHLPQRYKIISADAEQKARKISYTDQKLAKLERLQLPDNLAIQDVNDISIASAETKISIAEIDRSKTELDSLTGADDFDQAHVNDESNTLASSTTNSTSIIDLQDWSKQDPASWQAVANSDSSVDQAVVKINQTVSSLWEENAVTPVSPAEDVELLRRVYLDLAGRTPSVHEVRAYLNDDSEDRYERLVDQLLESPDHASHLAAVWRTFLIPEGVDLDAFGGIAAFDEWLAQRFQSGDGYDKIVDDLLLAEGRLSRSGPLLFYSAVKLNPDELAARTARVFLGMRLECAQCHDHPFEPWKQEDFWGFAAFFAQISRPNAELESVSTVMRVSDVDHGEVKLPVFETVVAPKHLNKTQPLEKSNLARREELVEWLTSKENPYFARATANRVWGQLFGKGIVDPIDDFGVRNLPKSSALLDQLASHFVSSDYDLRELFRLIVLSKPYQLSSGSDDVVEQRLELFAQMNVKTLTGEQVYDCISVATLLESNNVDTPYDFNISRFGNGEREAFLQQFRTPAGRATEYQGGIPQALTLMNGTLIDGATGLARSGLLASLDAPFFTNKQRIEVLYLATLSRYPSEREWTLLQDYIPLKATGDDLHQGLSDILWALLNSAEFTMNH